MKKTQYVLMATGMILIFAGLLGGILQKAATNHPGQSEVPAEVADDSNQSPSAQSDAVDIGKNIPTQSPETKRTDASGSDSLFEALDSYDALYQAIFAKSGGSNEEYAELGRRRKILDSLLITRINAAVLRKYRRKPLFHDYPLTINNVVDMIYSKPCRGCINIDYEIHAPTDVISGRLPGYLPYDSWRSSLHCQVKMTVAHDAANDEAFVQDISNNYCFVPISHPADQNETTSSEQPSQ